MRTFIPSGARLVPPQAERVFKGIIFDVYHWQQEQFDGSEKTFEMLKRPDTVKVIAIKDGNIVAIRDEQPGIKVRLTLPGGRNDDDSQDELACAKRELHEETGLVYKDWKLVEAVQPLTKIDHVIYTFVATNVEREDEPHVDSGGEKISVELMSFATAKQLAEQHDDPYWPYALLRKANSLDDLLSLPEIS